jgi:hypothetical protein
MKNLSKFHLFSNLAGVLTKLPMGDAPQEAKDLLEI